MVAIHSKPEIQPAVGTLQQPWEGGVAGLRFQEPENIEHMLQFLGYNSVEPALSTPSWQYWMRSREQYTPDNFEGAGHVVAAHLKNDYVDYLMTSKPEAYSDERAHERLEQISQNAHAVSNVYFTDWVAQSQKKELLQLGIVGTGMTAAIGSILTALVTQTPVIGIMGSLSLTYSGIAASLISNKPNQEVLDAFEDQTREAQDFILGQYASANIHREYFKVGGGN